MDDNKSEKIAFPPSHLDLVYAKKESLDCFYEEFFKADTSDQRGMILDIFLSGTSFAAEMISDAKDKQEYITIMRQAYDFMLINEGLRADGIVDPEMMLLITSREVLAGRMAEDDEMRVLALEGPSGPIATSHLPKVEERNKPRWAFWK